MLPERGLNVGRVPGTHIIGLLHLGPTIGGCSPGACINLKIIEVMELRSLLGRTLGGPTPGLHTLQFCLICSIKTLKKNNQVCMVNGGIALWGPTRNIPKGATATDRSENTARQCEGTPKEQDQYSSMQLLAVLLGPTAN